MLRKIIGAAIGANLAKGHPAVGGATGVMLATAVPFIISRISLPAMVAVGVGGYVAKRYFDRKEPPATPATPAAPAPTKPIPVQTYD